MKYKTTTKDFELYKKECKKWIDFWGLYGYEVTHHHDDENDIMGRCSFNIMDRWAKLILGKNWEDTKPTVDEIKITAYHEVLHLFFGRIQVIAKTRFVGAEEIEEEIHCLIRIMENKVYPLIKEE